MRTHKSAIVFMHDDNAAEHVSRVGATEGVTSELSEKMPPSREIWTVMHTSTKLLVVTSTTEV